MKLYQAKTYVEQVMRHGVDVERRPPFHLPFRDCVLSSDPPGSKRRPYIKLPPSHFSAPAIFAQMHPALL